jgi:4-hydroxy-3-methylbut-2-enyl diphosphate reductase
MSTETEAEAPASSDDDVPPEVTAMDGIASDEEAHNAERPARDSLKKKTRQESKGTPIGELEIGSMVTGKVKAIMAYGAFVDIGASTDALLHVSRLSDEFVSNVGDIVKEGETVEVRIVSVDEEKGQVGISMRSEEADNRQSGGNRRGGGRRKSDDNKAVAALAESGYDENKFVEGEVVSSLAFGAFVRVDTSQLVDSLEGTIEGLVHISSLAKERVESVDSVVSTGDKVQVRVKMVDAQGGKVSLSMISAEDEQPAPQRREKGQRAKKQRWAPSEMGAEDWQESLDKFKETQPAFKNSFVIVDKRKKTPVS